MLSLQDELEVISPFSRASLNADLSSFAVNVPASAAWPSANLAIFVPFVVERYQKIAQIVIGCGATGGGNFDVGIYDFAGNRLVSGGATARVASSEVVVNITDTELWSGAYWMAMSADSTGNIIMITSTIQLCKVMGIKEMSTAYTLPSTATFSTASSALIPSMALVRSAA